jgi:hypothetical protein
MRNTALVCSGTGKIPHPGRRRFKEIETYFDFIVLPVTVVTNKISSYASVKWDPYGKWPHVFSIQPKRSKTNKVFILLRE